MMPNSSQPIRHGASDSFYHCRKESENAREIVNQQFNIVLKYLQKSDQFKAAPICKKREISQVLSSSQQADETNSSSTNSDQNNLTKKRKLLETMLTASRSSQYQKMNS